MGRESRQARRARERRLQEQRQRAQHTGTLGNARWAIAVGAVIVALVAVVVGALAFSNQGSSSNSSAQATAVAQTQYTPVAGLAAGPARCSYNEMVAPGFYHVHAALSLYHNGQAVAIPSNLGFKWQHDCLYWVHTHSPSYGIIHIESPFKIVPTLGDFFHIWGVPLSKEHVWKWSVAPGQLRMYVNGKPYTGDPAAIKLYHHTDVTLEVGGPFRPPQKFNFKKYQV